MPTKNKGSKRWSQKVTQESNALDLEKSVFAWNDPKKIAKSLYNSALQSKRRKGSPLQSSMSMLNFYINRAGKQLNPDQKLVLEQAKIELRELDARNQQLF